MSLEFDNPFGTLVGSTPGEIDRKLFLASQVRESPVPELELPDNLGLFMPRQALSRILLIDELYRKVINVHGVIMEFGVRFGQNLALFSNLRGMYEPYNYSRKLIGFDTFSGFTPPGPEDNKASEPLAPSQAGDYSVPLDWKRRLDDILQAHELNSPIAHKRKYELVEGDASATVPDYLARHPETIVALAYFDFDLYRPTRDALVAIREHLTVGSVVVFDELASPDFPGETEALREVMGLDRYAIQRSPGNPNVAWLTVT